MMVFTRWEVYLTGGENITKFSIQTASFIEAHLKRHTHPLNVEVSQHLFTSAFTLIFDPSQTLRPICERRKSLRYAVVLKCAAVV